MKRDRVLNDVFMGSEIDDVGGMNWTFILIINPKSMHEFEVSDWMKSFG